MEATRRALYKPSQNALDAMERVYGETWKEINFLDEVCALVIARGREELSDTPTHLTDEWQFWDYVRNYVRGSCSDDSDYDSEVEELLTI